MCIICYKPKGVDMPTDKEIKHMFATNKDGAGFALQGDVHKNGKFVVEYHKGFLTVDSLLEALKEQGDLKDLAVVIHCRIGTAGHNDEATTHPFPLSSNYGDLRKLEGRGAVLFHNGVISGLGGIIDKNSSDTQDYVVGVAMRYMRNARPMNKISEKIVDEITGTNRILILYENPNYPIRRLGTWFEHNGCYYSNTGYEQAKPKYNYYSDWYDRSYYSTYGKVDDYGRSLYEYAWPSIDYDWILCSKQRFEIISKAAQNVVDLGGGRKRCTFGSTKDEAWILDSVWSEVYVEEMQDYVEECHADEYEELLDSYNLEGVK